MAEENKKALPGAVDICIRKKSEDSGYKGSVCFENSEVLAEALAVMMLRAAIELEVSIDLLYAKVASLMFQEEAGEDG